MTKRFVKSIWDINDDPEFLKECLDGYYEERKEALDDLKIGSVLTYNLGHYGDLNEFEITKINKKTGEITVEFLGGVPGI